MKSNFRRRFPRALPAAMLAGTMLMAGCTSPGSTDQGTLRIGQLVALSGVYQRNGEQMRHGFDLYLDEHGGRLGGHRVEVIAADEGDGPGTAVPAATKLVKRDRVTVVTGIVANGSYLGVQPLLTRNKIPLVSTGGRPPLKDLSYTWHVNFLSKEPGEAIAQYIKNTVDGPVYTIGPDYQGGYDQLGGFTKNFTRIGGKLVKEKTTWTPFPATKNFLPYFSKIAASGAKAIYTFYAGSQAVDFVRQYRQSDAKDIPLYGAGFLTEGHVLTAEGKAAEGIQSVMNYASDLDNATNRAFAAAWQKKYHTMPDVNSVSGYDAAQVLDQAVADADASGEVTSDSINAAMAELGQIDSPRGNWQFGPRSHSPVQRWYLREVRQDGGTLTNATVQQLATLGE